MLAASLAIPREYVSTAVLRVEPGSERPLMLATQEVMSRVNLAELMQRKDLILYLNERSEMPLEDVVGKMGSNLKIDLFRMRDSAMALRVEYRYGDARKAQAVVNAIVGELSAFMAYRQKGQSRMSVVEKASLPLQPVRLYRAKFLLTGLVGGLIVGVLTALTIRQTRRTLLVASMSAAGLLLGAGASMLVPNRYVSTAVIRVVPGDRGNPANAAQWLQQAATTLMNSQKPANRRDLTLQLADPRKMPLASSVGTGAMRIASEHQDPHRAQAIVQAAMLQLMEQNRSASGSTGSINARIPIGSGPHGNLPERVQSLAGRFR